MIKLEQPSQEVIDRWEAAYAGRRLGKNPHILERRRERMNSTQSILTHPSVPDTGVLVSLKNASRSMVNYPGIGGVKVPPGTPPANLMVFMRDPIERLHSAYQFFEGRPPLGNGRNLITWEEFIDEVLAGAKNQHWKPVSEGIAIVGKPVQVYKLSELNEKWPFDGPPMETRNKSKPIQVNLKYREDELKALYADDYTLLEGT